jgi:hypothetical protein
LIIFTQQKLKRKMTRYCPTNVICLNKDCNKPHYKIFTDRMKLSDLYLEAKEEMEPHKELIKQGKATCRYHFLCFERDCIYNHSGYALEGRKILIKKFKTLCNREKAKAKIDADIQDIRNGITKKWADM